jgi:hypothetical protein
VLELFGKAFITAAWLAAFVVGFAFGLCIAIFYVTGWGVVRISQGVGTLLGVIKK